MSAPAPALSICDADRQILEKVARSQSAAHREVLRARVLLDAGDGVGNRTIAARHAVSAMTVRAWREAFTTDGLKGWGRSWTTTPPTNKHANFPRLRSLTK